MPVLKIYDQLLQFPLFQGMSHDDLEIVAGHIRFGFLKVSAGKRIVTAGDPCNQLYFVISGMVKVEHFADDGRFSVMEHMSAPYVIQQEAIFGYYQRYTRSVTAQTDVSLLTIDKEEMSRQPLCHPDTETLSATVARCTSDPAGTTGPFPGRPLQLSCRHQDLLHPDGTTGTGTERQSPERVACPESVAIRRARRTASG